MKSLVAAALVAGLVGCTSEKTACREAAPVAVGRVLHVSPTGLRTSLPGGGAR